MSLPAVDGHCKECGFDYDAFDTPLLMAQLETIHDEFESVVLKISDEGLRRRPVPDVWSMLEYTCHVRDVLRIQRERLVRTLTEERPVFSRAGMWQWPERDSYNSQSPVEVLKTLRANAAALAATLSELTPDQLSRAIVYSYPEPAERTALWLIRHTGHEVQHHLFDIGRIISVCD